MRISRSLRRTITYLAGLVAVFVVIDMIGGGIQSYLLSHAKGGKNGNDYYICMQSTEQAYVFGSSRALHHYVPSVLSDTLGISFHNCGIEGTGIITAYGRWKMIGKRHKPELIIYDVNSYDYSVSDNIRYCAFLKQYASIPEVKDVIVSVSRKEQIKLRSGLYRYNSMFPQLVKDYLFEDSALADRHGYEPLTGVMSADAMISEGGSEVEVDSLKIRFLESLIHETKEMGVRMVAVYSPYYHSVPESEDDKGLLKEIFEREQIPYFDFRCDDRFSSHPELFEDRFHLNDSGAHVFSSIVARKVKQMVEQ